jgi:hypothetical protein
VKLSNIDLDGFPVFPAEPHAVGCIYPKLIGTASAQHLEVFKDTAVRWELGHKHTIQLPTRFRVKDAPIFRSDRRSR